MKKLTFQIVLLVLLSQPCLADEIDMYDFDESHYQMLDRVNNDPELCDVVYMYDYRKSPQENQALRNRKEMDRMSRDRIRGWSF